MMGHHGVKVELQDVDPGGWWFPGGFPHVFPLWGREVWLVLGRTKRGELEIRCEKFRTV